MNFLLLAAEFEAPNKWLPESAEIIWGTLSFLIVIGAIVWKAGPGIKKALADRSNRIGRELESSAKAKVDAEAEAAGILSSLQNIDAEKAQLVAEARETAVRVRAEGLVRNDTEVADLEARALVDIESAGNRITAEVQTEVASLAAEAAERIVAQSLDGTRQTELVEQFIATVGSAR
jgi:F-type H+-transporting ATPase subunit b